MKWIKNCKLLKNKLLIIVLCLIAINAVILVGLFNSVAESSKKDITYDNTEIKQNNTLDIKNTDNSKDETEEEIYKTVESYSRQINSSRTISNIVYNSIRVDDDKCNINIDVEYTSDNSGYSISAEIQTASNNKELDIDELKNGIYKITGIDFDTILGSINFDESSIFESSITMNNINYAVKAVQSTSTTDEYIKLIYSIVADKQMDSERIEDGIIEYNGAQIFDGTPFFNIKATTIEQFIEPLIDMFETVKFDMDNIKYSMDSSNKGSGQVIVNVIESDENNEEAEYLDTITIDIENDTVISVNYSDVLGIETLKNEIESLAEKVMGLDSAYTNQLIKDMLGDKTDKEMANIIDDSTDGTLYLAYQLDEGIIKIDLTSTKSSVYDAVVYITIPHKVSEYSYQKLAGE